MRSFRASVAVSIVVGSAIACLGTMSSAAAATAVDLTLPAPGTTVDGIPVALQYHDFYSYSADLLALWQSDGLLGSNTSNFQFSTGTGTISILPYTGAGGATNPSPFANPLQAPNGNQGNTFSGTWGATNQGTVGALLSFLQTNYNNATVPVFYFDNNQQSNNKNQINDLFAYGSVQIIDTHGNIVKTACFDTGSGNACTTGAVEVPGSISVTGNQQVYTVTTNNGSGKPDFFELDPGLDLTQFDSADTIAITINLANLNGGFEELGIVGASIGAAIPEPASAAILGGGLLAFRIMRRRQAAA